MSSIMSTNFSDDEALILQTMWRLKALANRGVTLHDLAGHVPGTQQAATSETLGRLEARGLVNVMKDAKGELFALSPLGAACARQLIDGQLSDLSRGP